MKNLLMAALLVLATASAMAQETAAPATNPAPPPDYSRDSLLRLFADGDEDENTRRIDFDRGMAHFEAFGVRFHVGFLTLFQPFTGTVPYTTKQAVDPFELTQSEFAMTSRTYRDQRTFDAERARIDRIAKVKVK